MTAPANPIATERTALLKRLYGRSAAQRRTLIRFAVEHYGGSLTGALPPLGYDPVTLSLLGVVATGETEDAAIDALIEAAKRCDAEVPA